MGNLPVILMELDAADNPMDIKKKYIYAHGQVLAQHDITIFVQLGSVLEPPWGIEVGKK